jgi:hypothetical protein
MQKKECPLLLRLNFSEQIPLSMKDYEDASIPKEQSMQLHITTKTSIKDLTYLVAQRCKFARARERQFLVRLVFQTPRGFWSSRNLATFYNFQARRDGDKLLKTAGFTAGDMIDVTVKEMTDDEIRSVLDSRKDSRDMDRKVSRETEQPRERRFEMRGNDRRFDRRDDRRNDRSFNDVRPGDRRRGDSYRSDRRIDYDSYNPRR